MTAALNRIRYICRKRRKPIALTVAGTLSGLANGIWYMTVVEGCRHGNHGRSLVHRLSRRTSGPPPDGGRFMDVPLNDLSIPKTSSRLRAAMLRKNQWGKTR